MGTKCNRKMVTVVWLNTNLVKINPMALTLSHIKVKVLVTHTAFADPFIKLF